MKNKLHIHYDKEGDLLEIRIGKPKNGYYKDLGDDIFQRRDEKTGEVIGLMIVSFKKRISKLRDIELPLPQKYKLF